MSKREPLKIGTKIKFTGPCVQRESIGRNMRDIAFLCWDEAKATVTKLGEYEGSLYVEGKSFVGWISRRQVTHVLVPRKKPCPPQGEKIYGVNAPRLELYAWEDAGKWVCSRDKPEFVRHKVYYRVVGCSEGEVPVSRERLAEAYAIAFGGMPFGEVQTRGGFIEMAAALGLEGSAK